MKNFFSIAKFKENQILFYLEFVLILIGLFLVGKQILPFNLFNLPALLFSIGIWIICVLLDGKTYFNFASLITSNIFTYGVFWFLFNIYSL